MFKITNIIKKKIINYFKNDFIILNKINIFITFFLIIFWSSLWLSISVQPSSIQRFGNNLLDTFNSLRISIPLILTFISTLLIFLVFLKKKFFNKYNNIIFLLYFYFFFQSIGLLMNFDLKFTLGNSYLIFLGLGVLNTLLILKLYELERFAKYFFFISFFFMLFFLIIIISINIDKLDDSLIFSNFYSLSKPEEIFLGYAHPRSTGVSRIFAFVGIILMIFNANIKSKPQKNFFYLLIFICSIFVWGFQSRGSIICYGLTVFFYLFFFENKNCISKIIFYLIFPILVFNISAYSFQKAYKNNFLNVDNLELVIKEEKKIINNNVKNSVLENKEEIIIENRFQRHGLATSGRYEIWVYSLNNFNTSKLFGYGAQGDRFILDKKYKSYGNNSSNLLIYALLSGGYFSVIIFLIIYMRILFIVIQLKKSKLKNKFRDPLIYQYSLATIFFFFLRSLIENSFSLFSIDFLITILSIFIVDEIYRKQKNLLK